MVTWQKAWGPLFILVATKAMLPPRRKAGLHPSLHPPP